jgi:hypothetical protein
MRVDNLRFETAGGTGSSSIAGVASSDCGSGNLYGINVDLYDATLGDLLSSTTTDQNGNYSFNDLGSGDYLVAVETPLGYSTTASEQSVSLSCGDAATVDFDFTCSGTTGSPRGIGFWKHQFTVATGGKGSAQVSASSLCNYLDVVESHFNQHAVNPVIVYQPPASTACPDKLSAGNTVINIKGNVPMSTRARQHLFALLMNVVAGYLHQASVISADGATVAQAITFCDNLIDNLSGNYELAKNIAETINESGTVAAGTIPLSTPDVRYKTVVEEIQSLPAQFSLEQNYPNPFNPSTVINYQLPAESHVTIKVYDVLGKEVTTLVEGIQSAGYKAVGFHADGLPSGLYFYKLHATPLRGEAEQFSQIRKLSLTK